MMRYLVPLLAIVLCMLGCKPPSPYGTPRPTDPKPTDIRPGTPRPSQPRPGSGSGRIETGTDTVRGNLHQIGNAPSFEMVIHGTSRLFGYGEYHVKGAKAREIKRLPLGPIVVKGKIRRQRLSFAGTAVQTRLEIDVIEYSR